MDNLLNEKDFLQLFLFDGTYYALAKYIFYQGKNHDSKIRIFRSFTFGSKKHGTNTVYVEILPDVKVTLGAMVHKTDSTHESVEITARPELMKIVQRTQSIEHKEDLQNLYELDYINSYNIDHVYNSKQNPALTRKHLPIVPLPPSQQTPINILRNGMQQDYQKAQSFFTQAFHLATNIAPDIIEEMYTR